MPSKKAPRNLMKIADLIASLEARAPSGTAEKWDNVGLQAGDPNWKTSGAVVSIDLTSEALELAESNGLRLIVTHHPCIFPRSKGWSRVVSEQSPHALGSLVVRALRSGIAIAACHTNFDQCALEVVERVSRGLGLKPKGRLVEKTEDSLAKLVVFVPPSHVEAVSEAICAAGAGQIGNYDSCTFHTAGQGTFRGQEGTDPFVGKPGILEKAEEIRLETIFPRGLQKRILQKLFKAHPYEEVAFDVYPVEQGPAGSGLVRGLGYGFWGEFNQPKCFSDVARSVRSLFKLDGFWVANPPSASWGSPDKMIRRVAFVAGKGASFIGAARAAGCELFVTGEAGYHAALDGSRRGIAVMELGHRESERFFLSTMHEWLASERMKVIEAGMPTQKIWLGGKK